MLETLPDREYRAGLYEILKAGVIRSEPLFRFLAESSAEVLARQPEAVDRIIAESVDIKAQVVSADEREGGLRRILNFGHTFGHALEAETGYTGFLHGEAVAFGMQAAVYLAQMTGYLAAGYPGSHPAVRADPSAGGSLCRALAGAPGERQEDHPGQGPFRFAGAHRSSAGGVRHRR